MNRDPSFLASQQEVFNTETDQPREDCTEWSLNVMHILIGLVYQSVLESGVLAVLKGSEFAAQRWARRHKAVKFLNR